MKGFFRIFAALAVLAFFSISTVAAADSDADRIIGKYKKSEDVSSLKEKGWSMPVKVSDEGDAVEIYAMKKGGKIREVVILTADDTDCVFVRIKCKVAESDIKDMVNGIKVNMD